MFELLRELWLPISRNQLFPFFSDARNLEAITPPWLKFKVLTLAPLEMKTGTLIDYELRLHGFPFRWQTEITVWQPPYRFVDEQKRGPYQAWRHEHVFEERESGTRMIDHIKYLVWGGFLMERFFVRRDLERIFAFRQQKIMELLMPTHFAPGANPSKERHHTASRS